MHVEFNSDLLFVASEHAGLHVRSLVPDFSRLFLLACWDVSLKDQGTFFSLVDARRSIMELPFRSQNRHAYLVRSRVPDVPRFQSLTVVQLKSPFHFWTSLGSR